MKRLRSYALAAGICSLAACGGGAHTGAIPQTPDAVAAGNHTNATSAFEMQMLRPSAPNPGSIKVPPMPVKPRVSASIMLAHAPHSAMPQSIGTIKYSQIPGAATQVVASPDGSLWALSTAPAGSDKYIFHYVKGTWTNIPGGASNIAIDGTGTELYAVNAVSGGVYDYDIPSQTWSTLGGGARAVTADLQYNPSTSQFQTSVYVLSSRISNGNSAIFETFGGFWYQVSGAGNQLAAEWDVGSWQVQGVGSVAGGGIYVANAGGSIFYYTPALTPPGAGSYQAFPGSAKAFAATMGGLFALGSVQGGSGPVYYFDLNPGKWSAEPGTAASVSASTTNLYVVASSNAIYSGSLGSNAVAISLGANIDPTFITKGSDNNLWLTAPNAASIGKYNPSANTYVQYRLPLGTGRGRIAPGSDGNLYATVDVPNSSGYPDLFQVTTGGVITSFTAPTSTNQNSGITTGPDGNIWFAESSADKIAKFTIPGHAFTEYAVTANGNIGGVTKGQDGNIWYTEEAGSAIGRITTAGVHTDFPVTSGAFPTEICSGSDGNLWFTEQGSGKIGRMTTSGALTEFPVPSGNTFPYGITAGPDGNIWYTEQFGEYVGRMTTSGVATEYPSPGGVYYSGLQGITTGADGNMYYTDVGPFDDSVDRISPTNP
jgi:streptogramin lyase